MVCPACGMVNRTGARFCLQCGGALGALPPGTVVGGIYKIDRVVGQGGFGAVYLVEDQSLFGKRWALKELLDQLLSPPDRLAAVQQFEQEARLLVALKHPNLPHIAQYFNENGRQYLVMEYVEGETLVQALQRATSYLPEAQVIGWATQVCDALEYLHGQKPPVIFRDLKPENIMVDKNGRVKLIDFGIARHFDPTKTTDTLRFGTVGYAPPEQFGGQGQTDVRSDIYALGATVHHLLTKRHPGTQPFIFPPVQTLNPSASALITGVVAKAVDADPKRRYQAASDMKRALLGQSPAPPVPTPGLPTVGAIQTLKDLKWLKNTPLPSFMAYCASPTCGKDTVWLHESQKYCSCSECPKSWETGPLKYLTEGRCKLCGRQTTWAISDERALCLGCGAARDVPGILRTLQTYCRMCTADTTWAIATQSNYECSKCHYRLNRAKPNISICPRCGASAGIYYPFALVSTSYACACLGCGATRYMTDNITGSFEAYCSKCLAKSPWLVHGTSRTCLWCGTQR